MAKITVNGVTYDSIEALPADVRRVYEQAMAKLPGLADRDGDGVPDILQGEGLSVRHGITVRKKLVVNGTTYDDECAMPPDVRRTYETAMRAVRAGEPTVKRNEIKLSFEFRKGSEVPPSSQSGSNTPMLRPIEPSDPFGKGFRVALTIAACIGAVVIWYLKRGR